MKVFKSPFICTKLSHLQCDCKLFWSYQVYYKHYQYSMYPEESSWWELCLDHPNMWNQRDFFSRPVELLPLPPQLVSVSGQFNHMSLDFPQLYQVHCILVPSLPGNSYSLCWPCCANITHDIPWHPLPPQLPHPQPLLTLMPWIWSYLRTNRSKVPA